ncbi:hypothetical protein M8Z33_10300 [Streptomyces sp. ZAF1911]|uniref:hypothetical protein n=1 Tax=Streptomyces sp. ZAF1911 TaxID=2944129 RepID=UPI00237A4FC3|nr:hypothetical protein [Streptomyces sp. ZAF1911]MDD9377053.1 hypothetical protein [Streptomyces sp. ZAF1911]
MKHLRNTTALAVITAAVGGMLLVPGTAHAAEQDFHITINTEGVRIHVVRAQDMSPVVHLRAKGSETRVLTIKDFSYEASDSSSTEGSFTSTSGPVKLEKLGVYSVDLEYRGTEGEPLVRKDAATLNYTPEPVFDEVTTSKAVSLDSLGTTVETVLRGLDPRDGKLTPLGGAKVSISAGGKSTTASTDSAGRLKAPIAFTGTEPSARIHMEHTNASGLTGGSDTDAPIDRQPVRIDLDAASRKVSAPYGNAVRINGSLKRVAADGTLKPVATAMKLTRTESKPVLFNSSPEGRFSVSAKAPGDTTFKVSTGIQSWLDQKAFAPVEVDITSGVSYYGQSGEYLGSGNIPVVYFNLTPSTREDPGTTPPARGPFEIQFSKTGSTWTTRKTFTAEFGKSFNQTIAGENGYWRVRYVGKDLGQSTSAPVHVARTKTEIPEFNAHPEPVKSGGQLTVVGKVRELGTTSTPAHGNVDFYFRATGTTTWVRVGYTGTADDGTFTRKFTVRRSGDWKAVFSGDLYTTRYLISESRVDTVEVTG